MTTTPETLAQQLTQLRSEVESLRAQLAEFRDPPARSMRDQCRCPACGATRVVHAKSVWNGTYRMNMYVAQIGTVRQKKQGPMEAYICAQCGLMEWYTDLTDVDLDTDQFRVIEGAASDSPTPYR